MKATNISIRNFKGIENRVEQLGKITVLLGENGSGKTSLLDAFRYACTGESPTAFPLRVGEEKGQVQVKFDSGNSVGVLVNSKGVATHLVNGKKVSKSAANTERTATCGVPIDVVATLMGKKENIFSMKPDAFASLMLGLMTVKVKTDDVSKGCEFEEDVVQALKNLFSEDDMSLGDIEKIYTLAGERVSVLKKETARLLAESITLTESLPEESEEQLHKMLEDAYKRLNAYQTYVAKHQEYVSAVEHLRVAQDEIAELRLKIAKKAVKPDEEQEKAITARLEQLMHRIALDESTVSQLEKTNKQMQKLLDELSSSVCPISKKLICTTDKTAIRSDIQNSIEENNEQCKKILAEIESSKGDCMIFRKNLEQIRMQRTEYMEYEKFCAIYNEKVHNLPVVPEEPVRPSSDENTLKMEISELNKKLDQIHLAQRADKVNAEYAIKMKEQVGCQTLRVAFAPKGMVYNWILGRMVGVLSEIVNNRAKEMGLDYEYSFMTESGLQMYGKKGAMKSSVPVQEMSDGEKFIAQFLLLDLVNAWSGLGFVVLDNLDCLDDTNLTRFLDIITKKEVKDSYKNIFIAGIPHEDTCKAIAKYASEPDFIVIKFDSRATVA